MDRRRIVSVIEIDDRRSIDRVFIVNSRRSFEFLYHVKYRWRLGFVVGEKTCRWLDELDCLYHLVDLVHLLDGWNLAAFGPDDRLEFRDFSERFKRFGGTARSIRIGSKRARRLDSIDIHSLSRRAWWSELWSRFLCDRRNFFRKLRNFCLDRRFRNWRRFELRRLWNHLINNLDLLQFGLRFGFRLRPVELKVRNRLHVRRRRIEIEGGHAVV